MMYLNSNKLLTFIFILFGSISWSIVKGQSTLQNTLQVVGEVLKPLSLTVEDLKTLPNSVIKVKGRDKQKQSYRGVPLHEILKLAGVTQGEQLRGESLAKYVLVSATDGYEVIFSLAETDPMFTKKKIILAYELDGVPLPSGIGPFRMVVPDEDRQARWIREIRSIHVEFHK